MLRVRGLKKLYGDKVAVDGVDFEVNKGEIFAILGPNGAGKTTTLKCIIGLRKKSAGDVELKGTFSYLPEEKRLYPYLKVIEIVDLFKRIGKNFNEKKALKMIEKYGIQLSEKVTNLSHGMRTILYLSLIFAEDVDLYILDEPTWGLDPIVRNDMLEHIRSLTYNGKSVLYTSHVLAEVEKIADRIAIMKSGKIVLQGNLDDIKSSYKLVVSRDKLNGPLLKTLKTGEKVYLVKTDKVPKNIEVEDASFEDIFEAFVRGESDVC
ncbi:ABC transporter ATP-binding protein [Thermotoga sp. KOL6]|uniref:ABC transporter ATP-binding protein n=1 Tax=Thermotoga sp. KOL6 TaxID=126741 RepID=UPI000C761FF8|nr:ABC transporter ATP-binding protein [Thermotoga sp. KOL6]PLV59463.1 multidrug ABC transporter ATP-binding protein [Thermotoga sp. KOL6]